MNYSYPLGPKSGWSAQATAIASGEIKTSPTDIPMLFEWLKDMNWPGATVVARYLPSFGLDLIEPLKHVLQSGDLVWVHWVLASLSGEFADDFWLPLKDELLAIARTRDEEGAHIEALYIIARLQMEHVDAIRSQLEMMKRDGLADSSDYEKVDAVLRNKK